ncbi:4'-phosphopantetheinyl transferase family protein [Marinobacter zhejiangensis]|uniref:4'-phosphopantetheinyl transferase n=1 Tax=Marinobacter zhejiangensis TaxID=488535 RepID=A0A1I4LZZ0_9GAMM|nr:4'-phosphopantetheinyl transferase superfamily protein [Marinobacter zhejiangensis]SFL96520.1 4'-phosphopantetheinyl transferase [Marinobacter zhejiangensis]
MTGSSNDCNPDPSIGVWFSHTGGAACESMPAWLSPSERARAERFHQTSRADFIHSRWLIRQTLAAATGHPVEYCRPVADRPVASSSPPGWSLSLSHSHGLVACVASTASGVGIDIEPHSRHRQWHKVVRRWFSDREQQWLLANDRVEDFLYAWTLKEAWLKATGRGIAGNLQTLEVLGDGQLLGDQPDRDWQASVGTFDGFTVAAVFHADHPEPPTSALLEPAQGCESLASRSLAANPVRWHVHRAIRHSDHLIQTREGRS